MTYLKTNSYTVICYTSCHNGIKLKVNGTFLVLDNLRNMNYLVSVSCLAAI